MCTGGWNGSSPDECCRFLVLTHQRSEMCFSCRSFTGERAQSQTAADRHHPRFYWTVSAAVVVLEKWCNTQSVLEREESVFKGCMQRIPHTHLNLFHSSPPRLHWGVRNTRNANKGWIYQREPAHKKVPHRSSKAGGCFLHFGFAVPMWWNTNGRMIIFRNFEKNWEVKSEHWDQT